MISNSQSSSRKVFRNYGRFIVCSTIVAASSSLSHAASPSYTGPNTGNWNNPANWSTALVPANGDNVSIGAFSPARAGQTVTVTFNANNLSGAGLNSLTLDSVNCLTEDLVLNGSGGPLIANTETIGGTITFNQVDQTAGANTTGNLTIASDNTSSGTYNLSGTGILNVASGTIGLDGPAAFTQNGGAFNVSAGLTVGSVNTASTSTYALNSGNLNLNSSSILYVGRFGLGTMTQTGSVTFSGSAGALLLGADPSAIGNYTLSGSGAISGAPKESIGGLSGTGTFTQTGGSNSLASGGTFFLGESAGGNGTYNLSSSTSPANLSAAFDYVGYQGTGTFNQSGGNNSLSNTLFVGDAVNSQGSYSLNAGNLSVADIYVGYAGNGTFTQSGGFASVRGNIYLGGGSTSGNGSLSISAGTFTANSLFVGGDASSAAGSGRLTISGTGSLAASGLITLYNSSENAITLSGGSLAAGSLNFYANPILFNWTAGNLTLLGGTILTTNPLTIPAAGTLLGTGSMIQNITLNGAINIADPYDDLEIHGAILGSGNITIASNAILAADTIQARSAAVNGLLRLRPNSLNSASKFSTLTLAGSSNSWTGALDVTNNKLIVQATPATKSAALSTLLNQAAFGRTHSAGIFSSNLPANYALAVLDNAVTIFTTFGGDPVDSSSLLISQELLGDTNADGHVDLTDLSTILNNFGQSAPNWTSGNFDNQPTIDLTDLSDVLNNFGQSNPIPTTSQLPMTNDHLPTPTPEPTTLTLLLPAALLLGTRRRNPLTAAPASAAHTDQ